MPEAPRLCLCHRTQGIGLKAQGHGGKFFAEIIQRPDQLPGRQHHIHHQGYFRFQPWVRPRALAQSVQRQGNTPAVRQDGAARFGQLWPPRARAFKQAHAQLPFQIGDGIGNHGNGGSALAAAVKLPVSTMAK